MPHDKPFVHPTAEVEPGVELGAGCKIWRNVHVRSGASIGCGTSIGQNCYIDSDVVIGCGVKIQNNVSVYKGVRLENHVFVGPSVVFTNDLMPRAFGPWIPYHTLVQVGASIGAGAVVVCGVRLGPFSLLGAGAVLTSDMPERTLFVGAPARFIRMLTDFEAFKHEDPDKLLGDCPICEAEQIPWGDYASPKPV